MNCCCMHEKPDTACMMHKLPHKGKHNLIDTKAAIQYSTIYRYKRQSPHRTDCHLAACTHAKSTYLVNAEEAERDDVTAPRRLAAARAVAWRHAAAVEHHRHVALTLGLRYVLRRHNGGAQMKTYKHHITLCSTRRDHRKCTQHRRGGVYRHCARTLRTNVYTNVDFKTGWYWCLCILHSCVTSSRQNVDIFSSAIKALKQKGLVAHNKEWVKTIRITTRPQRTEIIKTFLITKTTMCAWASTIHTTGVRLCSHIHTWIQMYMYIHVHVLVNVGLKRV